MCVWSAYTGKKNAAPLLWESLKKIEGIWAGYYTGLVTQSEGKLHLGKVLGNTKTWEESFKLEDFPGTSGLIHSRTNSGGDEKWGHPFVGSSGKVAIISQGCGGVFKGKIPFEARGNEMVGKGKVFASGLWGLPVRYPVLSDGGQVHSAEVAVQCVEYYYEQLGDPLAAIKKVMSELTTEAASCFLFADRPGVIGFSNSNQHMVYQMTGDGVYLSITTLGLPGNFGMELPCNSVGLIAPGEIRFERLSDRYETLADFPGGLISDALDFVKANPGCLLGNIADKVIKDRFPENSLNYRAGCAYRVLEVLVTEGKVRMENVDTVGGSGQKGTSFRLYAVEK